MGQMASNFRESWKKNPTPWIAVFCLLAFLVYWQYSDIVYFMEYSDYVLNQTNIEFNFSDATTWDYETHVMVYKTYMAINWSNMFPNSNIT